MGVYIKGMEMPTEGQIVLVEIDENGDVFAAYDGGRTKITQHKAVPVPPHGRLIDADALIELSHGHNSQRTMWSEIEYLLDSAPTIIPASEGEKDYE